jgi:spermidine synthase
LEGALALTRPWHTLAREATADGTLELRQRGERDFLITLDGRVLMTSNAHRSEGALAAISLARLGVRAAPRVLVGGLGMGFTLRAALDALPPDARVTVAELHGCVVEWCRAPLAALTDSAVSDPRVRVETQDVTRLIADGSSYDAIVLDLFVGPRGRADGDPLWGDAALARTREALAEGGVFGVWSEAPDAAFAKRLRRAGFAVEKARPGHGGLRHVVYTAIRESDTRGDRRRGPGPRRRSSSR